MLQLHLTCFIDYSFLRRCNMIILSLLAYKKSKIHQRYVAPSLSIQVLCCAVHFFSFF